MLSLIGSSHMTSRKCILSMQIRGQLSDLGLRAAKGIQRIIRPRGSKGGQRHKSIHQIKPIHSVRENSASARETSREFVDISKNVLSKLTAGVGRNNIIVPIQNSIETVIGYRPRLPALDPNSGCDGQVNVNNLVKVSRISSYDQDRNLSVGLWNARSINNKIAVVCGNILENQTDVFVVTETWIAKSNQCAVSQFRSSLSGYNIHQCPRSGRKGGGVAAITRRR